MSLNVSNRYGLGLNVNKNLAFQQNSLKNTNLQPQKVDTFQRTTLSTNKSVLKAKNIQVISFSSNPAKNPNQVALVGAEFPPYYKVGGVATVMGDYPEMLRAKGKDARPFFPCYNGMITYDAEGNPTGQVSVLKKDGKSILTNVDLSTTRVEDLKPNQYHELEEISRKTMQWGEGETPADLYKIAGRDHYVVYTEPTAKMIKPYASPEGGNFAYSSYSSESKAGINGNHGDTYAPFGKGFVETLPTLEKHGFNPATVICSDAQTATIAEYMAQKALAGDPYYQGVKPTYVMHNVGGGYQGETSAQNMFYNFATKEQVQIVHKDPEFKKAKIEGTLENYYRQFIPSLIDEKGAVNASMIPIRHAKQGYVPYINTVSELYAKDVVENPETAKGLTGHLKGLYEDGRFDGILNGFDDPSFDSSKPLGFKFYDEVCTDEKLGVTHEPFKRFSKDAPVEEILAAKKHNAKSLLGRLVEGTDPKYALDVLIGKHNGTMGHIDPKFINDDVRLFGSWGRGDKQKGLDIALNAFEKFVKGAGKDKNPVLVIGAVLDDANPESTIIKQKMQALLTDPATKGRVVFIDGFAPAKALASACEMLLFPSRFAPCELVDLEAKKYAGIPGATNMQGLAQKNPDPRIPAEAEKATSYKTKNPFHSSHKALMEASPQFQEEYGKLIEAEKKKLAIRGVAEDKLEEVAQRRVLSESNPKYTKLFRKCADDLLVDEFAEAMTAKVNESPETRATLLKNALNEKTGWDNNHELHPSGKSSAEMYVEYHINGESKPPKKTLFEFPQAIYDRVKAAEEAAKKAAEKAKTKVQEAIIKETSHGGKFFALGALATGLVGAAIYKFSGKKDASAQAKPEQIQINAINTPVSNDDKLQANLALLNQKLTVPTK